MIIRSPQNSPEKRQTPGDKFRKLLPSYNGPEDGKSHPKNGWLVKPINKLLVNGRYRVEVRGADIPDESQGGTVICPTHCSTMDPPLMATLIDRDTRSMAAYDQFQGIRGKMIEWGGAYPIYRTRPSREALIHSVEVIRDGKALKIYPEGGIPDEEKQGKIGPFKEGPAAFAIKGKATTMVPAAIHYHKDTESRPLEFVGGLLASAAVAGGGLLAASAAGPVLRTVAGVVTGAAAGAYLGGKIQDARTPEKDWWEPWPKYLSTLAGGAIGAVAGGAVAGVTSSLLPEQAARTALQVSSVAGGIGTFGIASALRNRDLASVIICDPLVVDDYVQQYGEKEAQTKLTEDLHTAMGTAKAELTGIPYDPDAPKIK